MSYPIQVYNVCEKCGSKFKAVVETRIDGVLVADTQKIGKETLNMIECPSCGYKTRAKFPVYYDNVFFKQVGIWYNPCTGTNDFYEMAKKFYSGYRDGKYLDLYSIETTKTWKDFKDKASEAMLMYSFELAKRPNKELDAYLIGALAYEFDIAKKMDVELHLSHAKPEFTLKDGFCFYTGDQQTSGISGGTIMLIIIGIILFIALISIV